MSTIADVLRSKADSSIWSVSPRQSVFVAIKLMSQRDIGALLVTELDEIVGIITERDYARKVVLESRSSRSTLVEEIMEPRVVYVEPHDSVEECMELLSEQRIRHLPVLEGGNLVGLVSMGDLVKTIVSDREYLIEELTNYVSGSRSETPLYQLEPSVHACRLRLVNWGIHCE
jgi:signal-transduction protein with cAMP-binding, CBS, and nucleotidyltransferase domain